MNKSRLLLASIGVTALVAFTLYTFGSSPLPKAGTRVEPVASSISANNNASVRQNSVKPVSMNLFDNKDMPENYYSIQFPTNFKVVHGDKQGTLIARMQQGIVSSQLMDVPDNSNLQNYVMTQVEPSLASSLQGYTRINLSQITVAGNNALDLTYSWKNSTSEMESVKTFIEGPDHAMVITSSWTKNEFNQSVPITNSIVDSFQWLRK